MNTQFVELTAEETDFFGRVTNEYLGSLESVQFLVETNSELLNDTFYLDEYISKYINYVLFIKALCNALQIEECNLDHFSSFERKLYLKK